MAIIDEIEVLLHHNWNYKSAKEIYDQYGTSDYLKDFFNKSESVLNNRLLRTELGNMLSNYSNYSDAMQTNTPPPLDAELEKRMEAIRVRSRENDNIRGRLLSMESLEDRFQGASRIRLNFEFIKNTRKDISFYKEFKEWPMELDKSEVNLDDTGDVERELRNARCRRTKAKKKKDWNRFKEEHQLIILLESRRHG